MSDFLKVADSWAIPLLVRAESGGASAALGLARRTSPLLAERPVQELVDQRRPERGLGIVGRARVAALDVLVVEHRLPSLLQRRGHFARVARMHAVVARRGGDQHRWIAALRRNMLVRRVFGDELPIVRV